MEHRVVYATVVALKHVFDGAEVVKGIELAGASLRRAFAEPRDIPDADSLVHGCGDDQVVFGMEESTHDVVRVSGEDGNAVTGGAVPDADGLVVGGRNLRRGCFRDMVEEKASAHSQSMAFRGGTAQYGHNRDGRAM